tara:strand:+ start:342 stop:713 length:372 start_codon:yes stop_codon:yes gene_type:complete
MATNHISTLLNGLPLLTTDNDDLLGLVEMVNQGVEEMKQMLKQSQREIELKRQLEATKDLLKKTQAELDNFKMLAVSQITCDCMVGGECEGIDNCANGMKIFKLTEELDKHKKFTSMIKVHLA